MKELGKGLRKELGKGLKKELGKGLRKELGKGFWKKIRQMLKEGFRSKHKFVSYEVFSNLNFNC